jgi:chaperonin GroES
MAAEALTVALSEEYGKLTGGWNPMGDRIIVLQDAKKTKIGSIELPETSEERPLMGTVLAVGPGYWSDGTFVETGLAPGDRVLFGFHSGHDLPKDLGENLKIMREAEVFAKL